MTTLQQQYDVAIIGGGLAGLALAIQLARQQYSVVLFERERYPFHKVCGEYISMESWCFLQELGVPLHQMDVPIIDRLVITAPNGNSFNTQLPLGGFGISRYTLDQLLYHQAVANGVTVLQETRVEDVIHLTDFELSFTTNGIAGSTKARVCCGAWGKRSNLDVRWQRPFAVRRTAKEDNYIAVKYHLKTAWPAHTIGLHNFKNGYCGISKIEDDRYCFCYLTTAANLKEAGGSIAQLQQQILRKNPHLDALFENSEVQAGFPLSIAQISFAQKTQVENDVLLVGDAGGMITPLCGNGMSMALHGSKLAATAIIAYLKGNGSYAELKQTYSAQWQHQFSLRLAAGRALQHFFGNEHLSNFFVQTFRLFPFLAGITIKKTHGQPF